MTVRHDGLHVTRLGYATARVAAPGGPVAYTDPGRYGVLTGEWRADSAAAAEAHPPGTDDRARDGDVVVEADSSAFAADVAKRGVPVALDEGGTGE